MCKPKMPGNENVRAKKIYYVVCERLASLPEMARSRCLETRPPPGYLTVRPTRNDRRQKRQKQKCLRPKLSPAASPENHKLAKYYPPPVQIKQEYINMLLYLCYILAARKAKHKYYIWKIIRPGDSGKTPFSYESTAHPQALTSSTRSCSNRCCPTPRPPHPRTGAR